MWETKGIQGHLSDINAGQTAYDTLEFTQEQEKAVK